MTAAIQDLERIESVRRIGRGAHERATRRDAVPLTARRVRAVCARVRPCAPPRPRLRAPRVDVGAGIA